MEQLLEILKTFIVEHPEYFTELETDNVPMAGVTADDVLFQPADLSRYENDLLCVIIPDSEDEDSEDSTVCYSRIQSVFTVAFICRGYDAETLIKQTCRYASGFRKMLYENPTLDDEIVLFELGQRKFYPDAGTVEDQMSAVEIQLTLITEEEL